MPAMLRAPPAMIQPHLDLKHFLSFPVEAPAPAGVFPAFGTMDPVQKAVLSHTFGTPLLKAKRPVISCNVCQIRFNSESQAEAHYKGNRHARRVKGIEAAKTRQKEAVEKPAPVGSPSPGLAEPDVPDKTAELPNGPGAPAPAPPSPAKAPGPTEPPQGPRGALARARVEPGQGLGAGAGGAGAEEEKAKKLLYCALCKVAVNSLSQLEAHNKGTKHKTILEARSGLGPIKAYPRLGPPGPGTPGSPEPGAPERTFHCEICNVKVNSEVQLKQHISSRRHRDGVAGKPNPLLSRHKKLRGPELAAPLAFPKELPKALAAGLLPNPLAAAMAMAAAASAPLALRPAAPLLQGPPLTHPLLRPAPGPIRTAHGPILFSPY
ncbi:zinc finger protein 385A isoform X2 [Alligator mississippiensis]|nr:zinc finger protein 385A isoform X2 [Alligator mississippiensis]XP_059575186.1 zinc finger protein 385A isoform X2 [Alligator mississippiensis]